MFLNRAARTMRPGLIFAGIVAFTLVGACSTPSSPTTPTPTPTPAPTPDPDPPTLSCPAPITTGAPEATGIAVTFTTPTAEKGKAPVTVACTPTSGSTFPIGTTSVTCTATDALNRTASCSFNVTVTRTPRLTVTHFLAFGDSITAGEISHPIGATGLGALGAIKLVVVPSASYPTQLRNMLLARYVLQGPSIRVDNEGLNGEKAEDGVLRFAQVVNAKRPQVVLLMHGYNNISNPGALTVTANQVNVMAAEARNRGAKVYIGSAIPSRPGFRNTVTHATIQAYNDRLREVARGEGAVFVDLFGPMVAGIDQWVGIDGLHPTEAGYKRIAEIFFSAIQATLEVP